MGVLGPAARRSVRFIPSARLPASAIRTGRAQRHPFQACGGYCHPFARQAATLGAFSVTLQPITLQPIRGREATRDGARVASSDRRERPCANLMIFHKNIDFTRSNVDDTSASVYACAITHFDRSVRPESGSSHAGRGSACGLALWSTPVEHEFSHPMDEPQPVCCSSEEVCMVEQSGVVSPVADEMRDPRRRMRRSESSPEVKRRMGRSLARASAMNASRWRARGR